MGLALNKYMKKAGESPNQQAAGSMKAAFGYHEPEPEKQEPEYEGMKKEVANGLKRKMRGY